MNAPAKPPVGPHVGRTWVALLSFTLSAAAAGGASAQAGRDAAVRFDVPQVVEAVKVAEADSVTLSDRATAPHQAEMLVALELPVSVIVDSLSARPIDQLLVEITPRGGSAIVADFAPRTELASGYSGGIEVQNTDEVNRSLGLALDAWYGPISNGKFSGGLGEKNIATTKFSRVAPLHLIAASGTTQRGRGVYFKFRSTDQQIIEGDRLLSVTLRVPATWRGELLDIQIRADSQRSGGFSSSVASITGMTAPAETVGSGRFLIASYCSDDPQGRQLARALADAEAQMRRQINNVALSGVGVAGPTASPLSGPTALLRHVSHRIDWNQSDDLQQKAAASLHRALAGTLDPHIDRDLGDLPVAVRVSCLDYLEARREYLSGIR